MAQDETTIEHFRARGFLRVRGAFSAAEAEAMREAVWRELARAGIDQHDPSTWTNERPAGLQLAKTDPAFGAVGSQKLLAAISAVLEGQAFDLPKNWGACFVAFHSSEEWGVPTSGWHADANYLSALSPPAGVRIHSLFGDVAPRTGGATQVIAGSHRLAHKWLKDHPQLPGTRGAEFREALRGHPYLRDLHKPGDREARIVRFMDREEEVDGIGLQVVENAGRAGDVLLLHPLTLHVAAPNTGNAPRFLLSGGIDLPAMWAAA